MWMYSNLPFTYSLFYRVHAFFYVVLKCEFFKSTFSAFFTLKHIYLKVQAVRDNPLRISAQWKGTAQLVWKKYLKELYESMNEKKMH